MKRLLHIVPGFGNSHNAISDYAVVVSEYLKKESFETFLQYNSLPNVYIISYVNVGYSFLEHLSNIFRLIKYKKRKINGLVFFHEAYAAPGKFYQKSFWYYPIECFIFKTYVRNAPAIFCSCEPVLKHIKAHLNNGVHIQVAPVPSNIVFKNLVPWTKRKEILVVFGTYGRRAAAVKRENDLKEFLARFEIRQVVDVGAGDIDYSWLPLHIEVKKIGYLNSTNDVAAYIASAKYGLINYPGSLLDKSGIFAAYAAAGLCVINTDESFLLAKRLYFTLSEMLDSADMGIEIRVKDLNSYYTKERSAEAHAEKLLAVLTK